MLHRVIAKNQYMFRTNICDASATNEYKSLQTAGADSNQIPTHTCDSYTSLDKYLVSIGGTNFFVQSATDVIFIPGRRKYLYSLCDLVFFIDLLFRIKIDTQRHNIFSVYLRNNVYFFLSRIFNVPYILSLSSL